ncbi:type II secretion system GspH family protein [Massilia sp. P8910]|uniref:type II secretion system protein n=1 Tax=Massilia antarctica TaxID=2765360 RepID=UPI001E35568B|nr:type II secretion system protein [Massilia antarctica]MCE3603622.1 type II secretion system GspH family protein [Massilia antarctica]
MTAKHRSQGGFTYLALLFMIAIMGAVSAFTGVLWSTSQQRAKERQLLFIGNEFRKAIGAYYERSPGTVKRYPADLQALLLDERHVGTVRHLRRIYTDPMTLDKAWGLVRAPDGTVMGVYSTSSLKPVKKRFSDENAGFENASTYSEWRFVYTSRNR